MISWRRQFQWSFHNGPAPGWGPDWAHSQVLAGQRTLTCFHGSWRRNSCHMLGKTMWRKFWNLKRIGWVSKNLETLRFPFLVIGWFLDYTKQRLQKSTHNTSNMPSIQTLANLNFKDYPLSTTHSNPPKVQLLMKSLAWCPTFILPSIPSYM